MNNFIIDASDKTPYFNLAEDGNFRFWGISMPEDASSFYNRILDWITDYYSNPNQKTLITVGFRYLNSSSSRMIMKIFKSLKGLQETGKTEIKCVWYYDEDDIDMKEYIDAITAQANNIKFEVLPTEDLRALEV